MSRFFLRLAYLSCLVQCLVLTTLTTLPLVADPVCLVLLEVLHKSHVSRARNCSRYQVIYNYSIKWWSLMILQSFHILSFLLFTFMSIHSGVCFAMQDNIFMRQLKDFHSRADSLLLKKLQEKNWWRISRIFLLY